MFFAVTAALDNMDPSYEEAAQMVGAPAWRASMGIALPLVLPAIVASSVFVFLEAMGAFGAPAAIGAGARFHTLTTKIYELFSYPPRFELAAAAAAPIIGFTILGLILQRLVLGGRRFNVIGGKSSAARVVDIGWRRWMFFGYCMAVMFVSVVLPLMILIRTSLLARWGLWHVLAEPDVEELRAFRRSQHHRSDRAVSTARWFRRSWPRSAWCSR